MFMSMFLNNQRRFNVKLLSQNHEESDKKVQDENKKYYESIGVEYESVKNLHELYEKLPKVSSKSTPIQ